MYRRIFRRNRWFLVIALIAILSGCKVGPNFHTPNAPKVKSYTESSLPKKTANAPGAGSAGKTQYFESSKDIPTEWWKLFHSKALNQLIKMGLTNSPTLASAKESLKQAKISMKAEIGAFLPTASASISPKRVRTKALTLGIKNPPTTINLNNAHVQVSYLFDFFGGERRELESLRAQMNYSRYEMIASYLTLTTNIVTTAINIASLQSQIKTTETLIRTQTKQLNILKQQFRLGGISNENVLSQQTLVAQTRSALPPLLKSISISKHSLSILVGAFPNQPLPKLNLNDFVLPSKLPVSLPSSLVKQRPDIQASEALLHSASAQIGVATANLLPQIKLNGAYGWLSENLSTLFNPENVIWEIGAILSQPILHSGALIAQRRIAISAYKAALNQYKQTVLTAFQNVADTLSALKTDAELLQAEEAATESAKKSLILTQKQLHLGGTSYLALLNAEQQYQQTLNNRIQAQASRFADTAELFQALGGGWWHASDKMLTQGGHK